MRRSSRRVARSRSAAMAVLAWILAVSACGPGFPEQERTVIRRGRDLIGSGPSLRVTETIPSDAILAGGEVEFAGSAGGDYLGAGGRQEIGGRLAWSVRAAGGDVRLHGEVERGGRPHCPGPVATGAGGSGTRRLSRSSEQGPRCSNPSGSGRSTPSRPGRLRH